MGIIFVSVARAVRSSRPSLFLVPTSTRLSDGNSYQVPTKNLFSSGDSEQLKIPFYFFRRLVDLLLYLQCNVQMGTLKCNKWSYQCPPKYIHWDYFVMGLGGIGKKGWFLEHFGSKPSNYVHSLPRMCRIAGGISPPY